MASLRDLKFAFVRVLSTAFSPLVRVHDTRAELKGEGVLLRPERTITWDRGRFTLHGPRPFWTELSSIRLDAAYALELKDVDMVGKGIVVQSDGHVVLESTIFQHEYLRRSYQNHEVVLRKLLPASHYVHAMPLINYLDRNYFHWMLESIGRLELVAERLADPTLELLVDVDAPAFVRSSIRFLYDVPDERIKAAGGRRRRIERCLLVSFPHTRNAATGRANIYDPELIRAVNKRALAKLGPSTGPLVDILITRRNAVQRRILNEDELVRRFPQLQSVALEDLSFSEQVALFARARTVIATHGAGLTNLLFARAPLVIELYPQVREEKDSSYFFQITDALGFRHHLFSYEPVDEQQDITLDDAMMDTIGKALVAGSSL